MDVVGHMLVAACMFMCVSTAKRAVSVLHPNRPQISQQPHLYALYHRPCTRSVCARVRAPVCVCVCQRHRGSECEQAAAGEK